MAVGSVSAQQRSYGWGYQPVYSQAQAQVFTVQHSSAGVQSHGSDHMPVKVIHVQTYTNTSTYRGDYPNYNFRTTSAYIPKVSVASFTPIADAAAQRNKARRGWDSDPENEDDPIGVVPVPQPVGSPLVLLLMAVAYILYRRRAINKLFNHQQKQ